MHVKNSFMEKMMYWKLKGIFEFSEAHLSISVQIHLVAFQSAFSRSESIKRKINIKQERSLHLWEIFDLSKCSPNVCNSLNKNLFDWKYFFLWNYSELIKNVGKISVNAKEIIFMFTCSIYITVHEEVKSCRIKAARAIESSRYFRVCFGFLFSSLQPAR